MFRKILFFFLVIGISISAKAQLSDLHYLPPLKQGANNQGISQQALTQLMMLNPSDIFRLVNLAGLDSSDINGALAIAIKSSLSQGQLFSLLLVWIILPLTGAIFIFRKKKI